MKHQIKRIICWIKGHRVKKVNVQKYSAYFSLCRRCYIPLHVARMSDKYYYHVDKGKCRTKEDFREFVQRYS